MTPEEIRPDTMILMANINNRTESVTMRAEMHSLPEVLETIERFIRGCGYNPEGQLNFVKEVQ